MGCGGSKEPEPKKSVAIGEPSPPMSKTASGHSKAEAASPEPAEENSPDLEEAHVQPPDNKAPNSRDIRDPKMIEENDKKPGPDVQIGTKHENVESTVKISIADRNRIDGSGTSPKHNNVDSEPTLYCPVCSEGIPINKISQILERNLGPGQKAAMKPGGAKPRTSPDAAVEEDLDEYVEHGMINCKRCGRCIACVTAPAIADEDNASSSLGSISISVVQKGIKSVIRSDRSSRSESRLIVRDRPPKYTCRDFDAKCSTKVRHTYDDLDPNCSHVKVSWEDMRNRWKSRKRRRRPNVTKSSLAHVNVGEEVSVSSEVSVTISDGSDDSDEDDELSRMERAKQRTKKESYLRQAFSSKKYR